MSTTISCSIDRHEGPSSFVCQKNIVAFVDGYNFHKSKCGAFGHSGFDTDFRTLSQGICDRHQDWNLQSIRYYAGIPTQDQDATQFGRWQERIEFLKSRDIKVITRNLRFRDGILREKGIDTRIAIDIIRFAYEGQFNVALLFSQDQDFAEITREVQRLRSGGLPVEVVCAFPSSRDDRKLKGVSGARWERIGQDDIRHSAYELKRRYGSYTTRYNQRGQYHDLAGSGAGR